VFVASSWFFYITLPTLMMHGKTQIKNITALLRPAVASNSSALSIMVMSPVRELSSSSGNPFSHLQWQSDASPPLFISNQNATYCIS
jgi:hypothetical protein